MDILKNKPLTIITCTLQGTYTTVNIDPLSIITYDNDIAISPHYILTTDSKYNKKRKKRYNKYNKPNSVQARERRLYREQTQGIGYTKQEFIQLCNQYDNQCLCCYSTTECLVPDHVIPLSRKGIHHISNIQPLCYKCNFKKGIQIIDYR